DLDEVATVQVGVDDAAGQRLREESAEQALEGAAAAQEAACPGRVVLALDRAVERGAFDEAGDEDVGAGAEGSLALRHHDRSAAPVDLALFDVPGLDLEVQLLVDLAADGVDQVALE